MSEASPTPRSLPSPQRGGSSRLIMVPAKAAVSPAKRSGATAPSGKEPRGNFERNASLQRTLSAYHNDINSSSNRTNDAQSTTSDDSATSTSAPSKRRGGRRKGVDDDKSIATQSTCSSECSSHESSTVAATARTVVAVGRRRRPHGTPATGLDLALRRVLLSLQGATDKQRRVGPMMIAAAVLQGPLDPQREKMEEIGIVVAPALKVAISVAFRVGLCPLPTSSRRSNHRLASVSIEAK